MDKQPKDTYKDIYKEGLEQNNTVVQSISPPPHQASTDQADIEALKDSYDDFLYVSKAFATCSINSLIATARIYGLDPAPIKGARVLELGSSCGGNIIPQALYYPEATFTGIDLSSVQIKHGNELIESMGLTNVTLLEKDIMDVDDDFGTFDYIIVHGIWSWVPDIVKDKILSICNRNLSDRGIAYVSYNTYPGWKRLEQMRDIMLYSEKQFKSQSLQERTAYTKNVLKLIGETMKMDERSQKQSGYKIDNINRVLAANDYYVGHEYLETFNDPVYVSEFIERAEQQGCVYIGDKSIEKSFITWLDNKVVDNIKALANGNHKDKEQYYDFVYDTQFRMALLTKPCNKDKIVRDETVQKNILDTLYFAAPFEDRLGMPPNWTDALRITLKQFMRTFQQFNVQDIVDYMAKHHPNEEYNKDTLYVQLFLLTILGHLNAYSEKYEKLPFVENVSYIPDRFIRYVATLIEGNGKQYMTLGNMFNQEDPTVDEGLLYVMKQMAQPTNRDKLIKILNEMLTITRTKADGEKFIVPSEQYLDESIKHLVELGYFRHQD
ncbi:MAG: class I SAM-dependent methyltransferase [Veillonella sp.]|uniref:class I SAM-dependent methyltransferase n=1 Tax=Veillonella sp. TaxID=1926307 RepID=UPI0025DCF21A|nr:class I SAM-dependent methyltransferase [Veillonella sp.]MBS7052990.1 class I SAM-dependent methyltransferase [Veillonella sp.]